MNILIHHLLNSFSTAKNLSKNKSVIIFFEIFIIRFFFSFTSIRKLFNKKTILKSGVKSGNLLEKKDVKTDLVLTSLEQKGYCDDLKLNKYEVDKVIEEISLKNSSISFKEKKNTSEFKIFTNNNDNIHSILEKSKKFNLSHVALEIDLNKTKNIKRIATSSFFLDIAKKYIGNDNISISSLCYISNPFETSEIEKKDNAQYFHYDNDFKKFFKVFLYLNDVDTDSGPHSFVKFSHKERYFKHLLSKRIDDQEIQKNYGDHNIIKFDRPKGSLIFEDTFGFHKGTAPKKNSRVVLILVYGKSRGIGIYKNSLFI